MSQIATDARFTVLDVMNRLYVNDQLIIDSDQNLWVKNIHANVIYYDYLSHANSNSVNSNSVNLNQELNNTEFERYSDLLLSLQGFNNISYTDSIVIGGIQNESSGDSSICIGGFGNEANGDYSTIIGGNENQTKGKNTIACGTNAIAAHDNTFVFNSTDVGVQSTNTSQFIISALNGMLFKLPISNTVHTNHVPEGFAIWCWDEQTNPPSFCIKTKQQNVFYKQNYQLNVHEIQVVISENGQTSLVNPDDS